MAKPAASTTTAMPLGRMELERVAQRCRKLATKRALLAAGVAAVPVPGIDWVTDVGIMVKLIPQINEAFGLTPQQIERLSPDRRVYVYKAISTAGGWLIGRLVTRELVINVLRLVGVRLTAQQAAKYVPIAGQAVSAALTFSALKLLCEQHIRQCIEVATALAELPAPEAAASVG
ncbi:MAG TPA: hypothetical protein VFV25_01745 [Methylibium sp.]